MTQEVKIFKLYDHSVVIPFDTYSTGVENFDFKVFTGSRVLFTLFIKSIALGASLSIDVLNNFSADSGIDDDNILNISGSAVGIYKRVITDFNHLFSLKTTVVGGDIDFVLAVSVFDNAMTTRIENAEIDVHLTHLDASFRPHDSIRIGGPSGTEASINADGSFNVNIVNAPGEIPEVVKNNFNESPSISTGIETLVIGYIVPSLKTAKLQRIEFSGNNIGTYYIYKNGTRFGSKHTWFNGPMHGEFSFLGTTEEGPALVTGDLIELKVLHNRPFSGDFSGRIQVIEIG